MPDDSSQGFSTFEYATQAKKEEPLVKLADVIKPVVKNLPASNTGLATPPENSVLWSYSAPKNEKPKEPEPEKDFTPGFDFSEKVNVEGKERKIELAPSGLYVFDKKEKFDKPRTSHCPECGCVSDQQISTHNSSCSRARGTWIGVKHPFSSGKILVPAASKPSDFKTVKVRGRTIKGILELTQPKKR